MTAYTSVMLWEKVPREMTGQIVSHLHRLAVALLVHGRNQIATDGMQDREIMPRMIGAQALDFIQNDSASPVSELGVPKT